MVDNNRELRQMIFCSIHLPPLPTEISRLDDENVVTGEDVESSHGIMCNILEWAAFVNNENSNARRLLAQNDLLKEFEEGLQRLFSRCSDESSSNVYSITCSDDELYQFYCAQTRRWVDTYAPMGHTLRFKPVGYVAKGDKIHKGMQGYAKAQCMLFQTGDLEDPTIDSMDYVSILRLCARVTLDGFEFSKKIFTQ
jgi:hypothetical protein